MKPPPVSLVFPLDVEDEWPPFAAESLPFQQVPSGYAALVPPLFVKNLSVGDIIDPQFERASGQVESWRHIEKSGRTTVWLLRIRRSNTIEAVLSELRALGCNTVGREEDGIYAVDVPESIPIESVDAALAHLDAASIATAFPSMRHRESTSKEE